MQIFVKDLPADGDVVIVAAYHDHTVLPPDAHPGYTRVVIDPQYLKPGKSETVPLVLAKGWRNDLGKLVNAEADRRIEQFFPGTRQGMAALFLQGAVMKYGADRNQWPPAEREKAQRIMAAQDYIAALRAAAKNLISTGPANPWHDSHWPSYPPVVLD